MNLLFISAWYPYPASNGSKLRIYNLIRGLAQHHTVTLISFTDTLDVDTAHLKTICEDVYPVLWQDGQLGSLESKMALFSPTPKSFLDTYSQQMVEMINRCLDKTNFDMVIASQIKAASYGRFLRGLPAVFEEIELGVMYEQFSSAKNLQDKARYGLTWVKHRNYLRNLLADYQFCTVASLEEKTSFEEKIGRSDFDCHVIPNGVDVASYLPFHQSHSPDKLIYTGSFGFYSNYEAMVWFVGEVLPQVQKQRPNVELIITGDHKNLPLPQNSAVKQVGFVDDIRPLVADSTVSLAPLLTGGGTRLKILEAMALKTPVVATSKGAQGLDATPGADCLIADTAEDFANAVIRLLENENLREQLVDNGYQLVQSKYDWEVILPQFNNLLECKTNSISTKI